MDQDSVLLALIAAGVSHCADVVVDQGNLLVSLFMTGLIGGVAHCAAMCGPFVLSQVGARLEGVPASRMREWHRLAGAALLPYQLGRLTTYSLLGAVGASLAGRLGDIAGLRWISAALLVFAALFFLGHAVPRVRALLPGATTATATTSEGWWARRVGRVAGPLFAAPVGWRGYALGVLLGFIPCGLLYGALAAAASTGDPLAGAFGMAVFALGTMPTLFGVGLAGHVAGTRWHGVLAKGAPVLLVLNAVVLSWMAVSLIA
ncbi:sulfite exporter TauE/SafE family protein [Novispirillum sp. DQ9]|uniref:sulfite exporter TauE/SafE family protein n=1 Tax=Novispirillum sp. DQ9 TaxID=3398612 RepID=UPI003C7B89CD